MPNSNLQLGANMRDFAYYGTSMSVTAPLGSGLMSADCNELRRIVGGGVVRFFASHVDVPTDECISYVRKALDLLAGTDMRAIVCLDDSLDSGFYVPGTTPFHTEAQGHLNSQYWLNAKYRTLYKDHTQRLVGALGAHPAVWLWEAGNEYAVLPRTSDDAASLAFVEFIDTFSGWMRDLTDKPISSGLISTLNVFRDAKPSESPADYDAARTSFAVALYEPLDAVSLHYYADNSAKSYTEFDIKVLKDMRPFYIGEVGAPRDFAGRVAYYESELRQQADAGARAVLVWGFCSSPYVVDGCGVSPGISDYPHITGIMEEYHQAKVIPVPRTSFNRLQYVDDLTICDGSVFAPNENMPDKIWAIHNSGTITWSEGYTLVHIRGDPMGAQGPVPLPLLALGEDGQVVVPHLTAPAAEGNYTSVWAPRTPDGHAFGTTLTIVISVRREEG